ncbi:MAG: RecX family transcriptional regulator [Bacteroidales bacterium]|jgi:regulatory protein|nr:RecX family transcriptional regulator [Bacteroidales bacterium]
MTEKHFFNESEIPFLSKAEQYCAQSEQCRSSVMDKLTRWGASHELSERIINYLVKNDYINERRFCQIYSESKMNLQKWGRIKIAYQLRAKRIDKRLIDEALTNLDPNRYHEVLLQLARQKMSTIKDDNPFARRNKLMAFLASHGFESDEIIKAFDEIGDNE